MDKAPFCFILPFKNVGQKKRNEPLKKDRKQILFLWIQIFKDSIESESGKLHPSPTPSPDSDSNPDSKIESGLGLTTTLGNSNKGQAISNDADYYIP